MSWERILVSTVTVFALGGTAACGRLVTDAVVGDDAAASLDGVRSAGGAQDAEVPRGTRLTAGQEKPKLACPTEERSVMVADFAHGADGAATPEEAVGPGLVGAGERLVLDARGTTAWVLRPDGTARMVIGLLHDDGWLLHQRTSCG